MSYITQNITVDKSNSARLAGNNSSYSAADDTATYNNLLSSFTYSDLGQMLNSGTYWRVRWFLRFVLPANFMPADATLHIKVYGIYDSGHTFYLQVRNSIAGTPPADGDIGDFGSTIYDQKLSSDMAAGWIDFTIPASALQQELKLALITDRDANSIAPTGSERMYVYGNSYSPYITISVPAPSKAPTKVGIIPLSDGQHTLASGIYHAAGTNGNTQCTQIQIQVSDTSDFSNILYDTGKVALDTPLNDGESISRILDWFPNGEGTYYIRIATWDDDNKDLDPVWGSGNFVVGYPSIENLTYNNDKEHFTFTAQIKDTYTKPPVVSLVINNQSWLMELDNRVENSDGTYTYYYSKTLALEKGLHEYHIEIGNVWTVLIGDKKQMTAQYMLQKANNRIVIMVGGKPINAWGVVLNEILLPNVSGIEFQTNEYVNGQIEVLIQHGAVKHYTMRITDQTKQQNDVWSVRAQDIFAVELQKNITYAAQVVNSADLLSSIFGNYIIKGKEYLPQTITLQSFINTKKRDILQRILILNNAYGYVHNNIIHITGNIAENLPVMIIYKNNEDVLFKENRTNLLNSIDEYYKVTQYPVPKTAITLFDAANWSGIVTDETRTSTGLVAPSGAYSMLKSNGSIARAVDFKFMEFDRIKTNWCPITASSVEIRLEKDASNYYKYVHTFAGGRGAGFILNGADNANEELTKIIAIGSEKYIHKIEMYTNAPVTAKLVLKLAGNVVYSKDYMDSLGDNNYWGVMINDIKADTIELTFTNLVVVNNSYGVNITQLIITEHKQQFQTTGSTSKVLWKQWFKGSTSTGHRVHLHKGESVNVQTTVDLGAVPALSQWDAQYLNKHYEFTGESKLVIYRYYNNEYHGQWLRAGITLALMQGHLQAKISVNYTCIDSDTLVLINDIRYDVMAKVVAVITEGQYVWVNARWDWGSNYNLFDAIDLPLSAFTQVGTPGPQINTIRLVVSGENYFDTLYLVANNPPLQCVHIEDADSIAEMGLYYQERKTDGWTSEEAAEAFAKALVNLFKQPITSYSVTKPLVFDVLHPGDTVKADEKHLPVYQVTYNFEQDSMIIKVGTRANDIKKYLHDMAAKIESIEKAIM